MLSKTFPPNPKIFCQNYIQDHSHNRQNAVISCFPATNHSVPFEDTSKFIETRTFHSSSQLNSTRLPATYGFSPFQRLTATISPQDFTVFTTDSQRKWRSQSPSNPPAQPEQQPLPPAPLQDFVLYDQPQPSVQPRSSSSSARLYRSRYNTIQRQRAVAGTAPVAPAVQYSSGSQFSPGPSTAKQPTATLSSLDSPQVPPLPTSLTGRPRPPVPLFTQRPVSVPQSPVGMDIQGTLNFRPHVET